MKSYSKAFFSLIWGIVVLCITSVQGQAIKGSGKVIKKELSVGDFIRLTNQSSANLYLVDASNTY